MVYTPDVYKWKCLDKWVYEFSFEVVHKDICVWGCTDCSHDEAFYLQVVFGIGNKVV